MIARWAANIPAIALIADEEFLLGLTAMLGSVENFARATPIQNSFDLFATHDHRADIIAIHFRVESDILKVLFGFLVEIHRAAGRRFDGQLVASLVAISFARFDIDGLRRRPLVEVGAPI